MVTASERSLRSSQAVTQGPLLHRASSKGYTSEGGRFFKLSTLGAATPKTSNAPSRVLQFELDNHLNSVSLMLDERAHLVLYEEYFPHGGTAFESTVSQKEVPKRYRYCGKEKDNETGLYYYGRRYLAPRTLNQTVPGVHLLTIHNVYSRNRNLSVCPR
ncbi:SpvB-domain-containing protein [Aspergillus udagawae]|uniref:SpvB-domain-containing protein n=1 Tax=Aspergillus udagawae TaxID=91492 RepID=A0A8H3SCF8_9EURO|nr:SpvB-domain-containing protein [Aspergillus udagawae]